MARRTIVALVLFALNGQGLGHIIRGTVVSQALASVGERPVVFSGGQYRPAGLEQFPARVVPSLWGAPEEVRKRVASELYSLANISLPAVVVEDTHPAPIQLPPAIRRVLLVRPTSFEYLARLNQSYSRIYSAFLLCDAPNSPTWPYGQAQSRQLAAWRNWHVIGPVYRSAPDDAVRQVRERHHLAAGEEVCVFSMGGGGAKNGDPKRQDFFRFLKLSLQVADVIHKAGSRVRLLFVKGPYFPARIPIPPQFEVVPEENQMPALLKIAKGVVLRAGFNTPWECIAAGTPFMPMIGTTYAEPVPERLNRMTSLGLVPPDIESFWFEGQWRADYRRIAQAIVARHSGVPEPLGLRRLILGPQTPRPAAPYAPRAIPRTQPKRGIPLAIRVDDVVCREPALVWLLNLLAARGLRATLEVVPYLMRLDEKFLDRFDPSRKLFEVSQHGYAHVPRTADSGQRCEFSLQNAAPPPEDVQAIARGKQMLEAAFPNRFTGGFSPPFDALPPWLPAIWHSMGGTFVSCLGSNTFPGAPLPVRRAGVDVWDWTIDGPLSPDVVKLKLAEQYALDGHSGIVLHPRCLRRRSDKLQLRSLLDLIEESTVAVSLRDLALGKIQSPGTAPAGRPQPHSVQRDQ